MLDFNEFIRQISLKSVECRNGVYFNSKQNFVSYPNSAHAECFQMEDESFWFKHRNECIVATMNNFPPGGALFDIGGGNGCVSKAVELHGYPSVLIEPGFGGILNAKKRGLTRLICANFSDLDLLDDSIPAAGLFDVLEHVDKDVEFLKDIKRALISDGRLYITVPAYNFLWSDEDDGAGHYRRYTLGHMRSVLNEIGFTVEYHTYIFLILPFVVFLFRSLPSRLRFSRNMHLNKFKKEHQAGPGILGNVLSHCWKMEVERIYGRKRFPFGGSCLLVAKKRCQAV